MIIEIEKASKLVTNFLQSNCKNKEEYLKETGMKESEFDIYLNIIQVNDPNIYNLYKAVIDGGRRVSFIEMKEIATEIINYLKKGTILDEITGEQREFNLTDYYLRSSIPIEQFQTFCLLFINRSAYLIAKRFNIKTYEKRTRIFNLEKAMDDLWIYHGHEFTLEEKENIVVLMESHNMIKCESIYKDIGRRYVNGLLEL